MQTLIIDNYDSFTFNLYQILAVVNGQEPVVVRNDRISWQELNRTRFDNIVISPGPGRADRERDFGICSRILAEVIVPVLGVCLGHQGLGHVYGGEIIYAPQVMHGRLSRVYHDHDILFRDIPRGFLAVRYHSLVLSDNLPVVLKKTAWTDTGVIMGIRHREKPLWGVQFHPESICTEYGRQLLENFRFITEKFIAGRQTIPISSRDQIRTAGIFPAAREQRACAKKQYHVSVCKLDFFPDPELVFRNCFRDQAHAVWFDSSRIITGFSRFSFMGAADGPLAAVVRYNLENKQLIITEDGKTTCLEEDIFTYLQRELQLRQVVTPDLPFQFNCGYAGYLGYELKAECGSAAPYRSACPDAVFVFLDRLLVFDHLEKTACLLCLTGSGNQESARAWFSGMKRRLQDLGQGIVLLPGNLAHQPEFYLSRDRSTYLDDIARCLEYIREGESYEICLTNKLHADVELDPLAYYLQLRRRNAAPYSVYMKFGDIAVAGASPERFLTVDKAGRVEAKPMKGTIRRDPDPGQDRLLKQQLAASEKDRAENLMICDLLRNDLGIVCAAGSVHVPSLMTVETYATVHQMVSTIRGRLCSGMTAVDCIRYAFPGGSMTGAPKLRTMQIIDSLEKEARGIYSGIMGYLALSGAADFNIVIRTAVISPGHLSIGIGGAVTALSDPELEFDEIILKGRSLAETAMYLCGGNKYSELNIKLSQ